MNDMLDSVVFRNAAEDVFHESLQRYVNLFSDHLEKYTSIIRQFNTSLKSRETAGTAEEEIRLFLDCQKKIRDWLSSSTEIHEYISSDMFPAELAARFNAILVTLPEEVVYEVPGDLWLPQPEDSLRTRIRKRYRRTVIFLEKSGFSLRNKMLGLLHKKSIERVLLQRKFNQHALIKFYFEKQVMKIYVKEIQYIIKAAVDQILIVHETANNIDQSILTVDDSVDDSAEGSADVVSDTGNIDATVIGAYLESLSNIAVVMETALLESKTRFLFALDADIEQLQKKWKIAGTILLPGYEFSEEKYKAAYESAASLLAKNGKLWSTYIQCEEKDWLKDIELSILQLESEIVSYDTVQSIRTGIDERIKPALNDTGRIIKTYGDKFQSESLPHINDFMARIDTEKASLLKKLREITLTRIMDQILQVNIIPSYQSYVGHINAMISHVSDEHFIFEARDRKHVPPVSKVSKVALAELISAEVYKPLAEKHEVSEKQLQEKLRETMRSIAEIDQIVEYNMNAALSLLEEQSEEHTIEDAEKLITDGLERTQSQVNELITDFDEIAASAAENIAVLTTEFQHSIQKMADNDKVLELKIKLARAKTRDAIRENIRIFFGRARRFIRSVLPSIITFIKGIEKAYVRVLKMSGFAPVSTLMDMKLSELLLGYQTMSTHLPYVYQKLFGIEPLKDSRFFSSRDEEMSLLRETFTVWLSGHSSSISLVGERGSGKTTLLYFAQKDIFQDTPIISIDLQDTLFKEYDLLAIMKQSFNLPDLQSIDEFEDILLNREERVICVFENLHNLFLRTVDGFEAVERFMLLIQNTGKSVFWVVTCALYGWQYLDKVIQVSGCFSKTVELTMGKKDEIEDTITKRHRVSGYILKFDMAEGDMKSKTFRKLRSEDDRQKFLRERFFNQLSKLAAGNIRVAILFWLMSIKDITNDTMILSSGIEFEHAFVYQLPAGELFSLAAIIQHEHLNPHMHSHVFNQNVNESRMVLNRMLQKGYLQQKNDQYSIHPFLYRPVVKALKSKNILQ